MAKENRALGTLALIACAVSISMSALLHRVAFGAGMHALWLNVFRLGVAVVVMLPFFLKRPDWRGTLSGMSRSDRLLTLLSGVMLAGHFASWALALAYADSLVAVSIWSTFSLMTVLGSALLLKEKTPLPALLGILAATVGVGICAIGATGSKLLGVAMALISAITQAVYTLCGRAVRKKVDMLPYTMVVYSLAFGLILLCTLCFGVPATGMNAQGIGAGVLLALVCTLGGHSMQNYALKYYKAPTVSAAILTEVFTGPLLVFFVLGEVPGVTSMIGGAMILSGVGWYMYREWRSRRAEAGIPA